MPNVLSRILGALVPRDTIYSDLFEMQASVVGSCAEALASVRVQGADADSVATLSRLEHKADEYAGAIIRQVERAVITPMEPQDMVELVKAVDNIVDLSEDVVTKMSDYRLVPDASVTQLIDAASRSLELVSKAVMSLRGRGSIKELRMAMKACEHEADKIIREVIAESFPTDVPGDPEAPLTKRDLDIYIARQKRREVGELLEDTVDSCEDVFHSLANIYLKF